MSATGTWSASIESPLGAQEVAIELLDEAGKLSGSATSGGDTVELKKAKSDGNRVTFAIAVAKPMKMTLHFDVTIAGDAMSGTAKAGIFPAAKVVGRRTR